MKQRTRHFDARMNERGISDVMVDIACRCGMREENSDRITFSRKPLRKMISMIDKYKKELEKMERKGGLTVVELDEHFITTFFVDSYKRGKNA